jgi:hypothetical protein
MLQFTYKLKITERVKGKCSRHPRYNPEKDGRAGIRGGCSCCFSLYDLYQARMALDAAQREFIRRATPWTHPRQPRRPKSASEAEPSSETVVRRGQGSITGTRSWWQFTHRQANLNGVD